MLAPIEEHNRCWRLRYADEVSFHLDTLACVPEDADSIQRLVELGVTPALASRAVGITDRRHPNYRVVASTWPSSNPRGFAHWLTSRAALGRAITPEASPFRAAVEDVPPHEWKTPLQQSIQILKRHRDVMFRDSPELAPISMIITNLAAHAYRGERDLFSALTNIAERMALFVRPARPRVPNPADPAEDYADKWSRDARLENQFLKWLTAVRADIAKLPTLVADPSLGRHVRKIFGIDLTPDEVRQFEMRPSVNILTTPTLIIASPPKPWGKDY